MQAQAIPACNPKKMLEIAQAKLRALGFTNFKVSNNKRIMFSVTNQGQSTDEVWRTFPIFIDIRPDTVRITIHFHVYGKAHAFQESMKPLILQAMVKANLKIPTGSFKYLESKKSLFFDCVTNYNLFHVDFWDSLLTDCLKMSMGMFKSFGLIFVEIINGKNNISELIDMCINRTGGLISPTVVQETSSAESSDESSSNTEELSQNRMDENLQDAITKDQFLSRILKFTFSPEHDNSLPYANEIFKDLPSILILMEKLKEIYRRHVQINSFNLTKIRVAMRDNVIDMLFLKKTYKLLYVAEPNTDSEAEYEIQQMIEFNKQLLELAKNNDKMIIGEYHDNIICNNRLQYSEILANENIIGQGGFGIVYKNVLVDIPVAIKVPKHSERESKNLSKLIKEFRVMMELNHENIVKAYGFVKVGEKHGIILEQCMGGSIGSLIKNQQNMALKKKLEIMLKILRALEYMHCKNYCHFDIKPHNILLDNNLEPKISDLGLSRNVSKKNDHKPGFTLIFCSPEQIKGRNPGKMSDIWSYGMTLYNFVTQIPPFDYLTRNTKKKLDKMEFYNELVNNLRKPRIVDKFEIENPKLVKLMRSMWEIEPEKRPTCKDIRRKLGKIYNKLP